MTTSNNPLRFGINLTGPDRTYTELLATARLAEELGFDTVAMTDRPPEKNFEAWTLASAIGVLTQRIRLTHNTLNVPLRNAALLAKMAASLDAIAGADRVILTLGAGTGGPHFTSYGAAWGGTPGERVTDLQDCVAILRGLWANQTFTYQGRVHSVEEATVQPRPAGGGLPIYIGALGPRMLRYTGAVADGWLKNRGWPESPEELQGYVAVIDQSAEKAGRDPRGIRRVLNGAAGFGESAAADAQARASRGGAPAGSGNGLLGSPAQILETIQQHRAAGADTFHLAFPAASRYDDMRRFAEEVLPQARAL
jgi:alkanesulfonate monooxygenase SsuD/methylene tetrahydromethanopterin reductase-like flavin-dependent oxidoreductase (luciferase family)